MTILSCGWVQVVFCLTPYQWARSSLLDRPHLAASVVSLHAAQRGEGMTYTFHRACRLAGATGAGPTTTYSNDIEREDSPTLLRHNSMRRAGSASRTPAAPRSAYGLSSTSSPFSARPARTEEAKNSASRT